MGAVDRRTAALAMMGPAGNAIKCLIWFLYAGGVLRRAAWYTLVKTIHLTLRQSRCPRKLGRPWGNSRTGSRV